MDPHLFAHILVTLHNNRGENTTTPISTLTIISYDLFLVKGDSKPKHLSHASLMGKGKQLLLSIVDTVPAACHDAINLIFFARQKSFHLHTTIVPGGI